MHIFSGWDQQNQEYIKQTHHRAKHLFMFCTKNHGWETIECNQQVHIHADIKQILRNGSNNDIDSLAKKGVAQQLAHAHIEEIPTPVDNNKAYR